MCVERAFCTAAPSAWCVVRQRRGEEWGWGGRAGRRRGASATMWRHAPHHTTPLTPRDSRSLQLWGKPGLAGRLAGTYNNVLYLQPYS